MTDTTRPYIRFDEIKVTLTWHDIFEAFDILDNFKETNGAFVGPCPLPKHQHGDHPNRQGFKADHRKGYGLYKCWGDCSGTDYGEGDIITFVKAMTGRDNEHVRFWFADHFGDQLATKKPRKQPERKDPSPGQEERLPAPANPVPPVTANSETSPDPAPNQAERKFVVDGNTPLSHKLKLIWPDSQPFLEACGISMDTAKRYGGGNASSRSKMFRGYFCLPIYRYPAKTDDEFPVGYYGRILDDAQQSENLPRHKLGCETKHLLFGLKQALLSTPKHCPLIIFEGPLKCLWYQDRGWTNAISAFTSSLNCEPGGQIDLLVSIGRPVVIAFDGDEAGQRGLRQAMIDLYTKLPVAAVKLPPEHPQPDQLEDELLHQYFDRWLPE